MLSHHPYSVGGPTRKALNADDVSVPDLDKLVDAAAPAPSARGASAAPGVTPSGSPSSRGTARRPTRSAFPTQQQARWLEESLYVLWRNGVDTVIWFLARNQGPDAVLRRHLPVRHLPARRDAQALGDGVRVPVFAEPVAGGKTRLWGKAPAAGRVVVQRRAKGRWVSVASFHATAAGRVFTATTRRRAGTKFRARAGAMTSLMWPN